MKVGAHKIAVLRFGIRIAPGDGVAATAGLNKGWGSNVGVLSGAHKNIYI
ncbi:MAG: hypothetical protein RLN67_04240 [Algiphilus sp.]